MRCRRWCSPTNGPRRRRRTNRGCCRRWPGRRRMPSAPTLKWEGLDYRVDLFARRARAAQAHPRADRIARTRRGAGGRRRREDRRCAAGADLHAGARRSGRARRCSAATSRSGTTSAWSGRPACAATSWRGRCRASRSATASPWHVEGSLLGLDIALARLALRRIADNEMPVRADDQPQRSADLRAHGDGAQPARAPRRRIAIASSRRSRAAASASRRPGANLPAVLALADRGAAAGVGAADAGRGRITRTPDAVPALFGLRDLMWLGKPDLPQRDARSLGRLRRRASTAA